MEDLSRVIQFERVFLEALPCVVYAPIDLDGQVGIVVTFLPTYTHSFDWFHTWPAASTMNMAVDSGIPFVRQQMTLVLASSMVRSNVTHTTAITPTIFLGCWGGCETIPASSALKHTPNRRRQDWHSGGYSTPSPNPRFLFDGH